MRELKFRVYADVSDDESCVGFLERNEFFDFYYDGGWRSLSYFIKFPAFTVQQYTGLNDKNGKEIYEGDIVRFDEPRKLCDGFYMASLYVFDFYEGNFLNPYIYNSINGSKFVKMEKNALNPTGRAKLDRNPHFDWTKAEICGNVYENQDLIDL